MLTSTRPPKGRHIPAAILLVVLGLAATLAWNVPFLHTVWMDVGCVRSSWTACELHVGVPQVLDESDVQNFEEEYDYVLRESAEYLQRWMTDPTYTNVPCKNEHMDCAFHAALGRCERDDEMKAVCALACQTCHGDTDLQWPMCVINPSACEMPQFSTKEASEKFRLSFESHVGEGSDYLEELDAIPDLIDEVRDVLPYCKNEHAGCSLWALFGMCNGPDRFHDEVEEDMRTECPVACRSCEDKLYEFRCPLDPDASNAWEPGALHELFWNVTSTPQQYENIKVWSSPTVDSEGNLVADTAPWVISIDDFLTSNEIDALVEHGDELGFERSDDWAEYLPDGSYVSHYHDGRTSYQAWCSGECEDDETVNGILQKIEDLTRVPMENGERLQLLRYEESQKYDLHHDWDSSDVARQQGVRIMTVFLYLSDVADGGGTHFPHLDNLTFTPRKGRMVMWPNVMNMEPHVMDPRTHHAALPVAKGVKYAANSWLHQRSAWDAFATNCYE